MTKKAFKDLTERGKQQRIAKYKAQDAEYGLKEGLFRIYRMSHHADKLCNTKNFGQVLNASFGYYVVPVAGVDAQDFKPGEFRWVNQLINKDKGATVIAAMDAIAEQLKTDKTVRVQMKYKKNAAGFINVNSIFLRPEKNEKKQAATQTAAAATEDLPY